MIFGEEVELKDENINAEFHQYVNKMLYRDPINETSKLDIIGMHCNIITPLNLIFQLIKKHL